MFVPSDPMSIDEAFKVTYEMSKLLDETLLLVAKHLAIPAMELGSSKGDKWRYCGISVDQSDRYFQS